MIRLVSLTFLFCFYFLILDAQGLKKIKEFKPVKIDQVAVDRLGNFFLVFKNGSIKKYDLNGKVLATLEVTESEIRIPTLMEPWFHPTIFLYFKKDQRRITYDHNFGSADQQRLDPSNAINPTLVCPTNDNKLLVLDEADYSIKRINPTSNQVITEFYIDTAFMKGKPDFIFLREYQNLIFLHDRNLGISIYSNVGKKINQIKTESGNFGFFGEELYYYQNDEIIFYDLYTEKTRQIKIPDAKFILVTDERILEVKENGRVIIFEFSEKNLASEDALK